VGFAHRWAKPTLRHPRVSIFDLLLLIALLQPAGCKRTATTSPAQDLATARMGFVTELKSPVQPPVEDGPPDQPPADVFKLIHFPAPPGPLAAYLRIPPGPAQKHPAVLWCHGGFGGIDGYYAMLQPAANDQTPKACVDAGFVVLLPSWRGTNNNPGKAEMFYGEVDDAMAAVDYLASLPEVDASRIYVIGHSTGGTLALLTAEMAPVGKIRAAFSFGGAPDMRRFLRGDNAALAPFDISNPQEMRLRSATDFITTLRTPTWYFEGSQSAHAGPATIMAGKAIAAGVPFHACIIDGGTHFNILRPITHLVAEKVLADNGPVCNISISDDQVQSAFAAQIAHPARQDNSQSLQLTPQCQQALSTVLEAHRQSPESFIFLSFDLLMHPHLSIGSRKTKGDCEIQCGPVPMVTNAAVLAEIGPILLDYDPQVHPSYFIVGVK
jgi:acetyl esterase/lipase